MNKKPAESDPKKDQMAAMLSNSLGANNTEPKDKPWPKKK